MYIIEKVIYIRFNGYWLDKKLLKLDDIFANLKIKGLIRNY